MKFFKLKEYIDLLKGQNLIKFIDNNIEEILNENVEYISYNSKDIKKSTMFICKGATFKIEYLLDAIVSGSFIYISDKKYDTCIPGIIVTDIRLALSVLSAKFFDNPATKLNVIGITGTKGKSTTSYFVKYILDEYSLSNNKKENAIISSIYTYDGKNYYKSKLTTPESLDLQRNLYNINDTGIENVVMEVSSQALKYARVNDVNFEISAFLNISEDHISPVEHPDFEDYFASKLEIFKKSIKTCINLDMDFASRALNVANKNKCEIHTFSTMDNTANVYATNIHKNGLFTEFDVVYSDNESSEKEKFSVMLTIPGLFNVENALAAISIAKFLKIPTKYIISGLKKAKSEGRMEIYSSSDKKILAIVDYAHNKLSFEKIFETTKKEYPDRKIISIFGCPGNKAQIRRKDLGEVASINSDYIFLTEDDPAYESVLGICSEIEKYVLKNTKNYEIVEDRDLAIKKAVHKAILKDEKYIILILGKGNEHTQKVGSGYKKYTGDSENIINYIKDYENNS